MATTYPLGYGTTLVTMDALRARHAPKAHPEFARRLFAWIESKEGLIGIGSGWRANPSDTSAASKAGKSFHQDQRFASGFFGYSAVDLVARNPGKVHRAPSWAESADAAPYGLHTFIQSPPEPWHMQCIEMRGYDTWVNAGRPDPQFFPLPGTTPQPPEEFLDMVPTLIRMKGFADVVLVDAATPMPVSPEVLAQLRKDKVREMNGDVIGKPMPLHAPTKLWLEHQLGYKLTASQGGV